MTFNHKYLKPLVILKLVGEGLGLISFIQVIMKVEFKYLQFFNYLTYLNWLTLIVISVVGSIVYLKTKKVSKALLISIAVTLMWLPISIWNIPLNLYDCWSGKWADTSLWEKLLFTIPSFLTVSVWILIFLSFSPSKGTPVMLNGHKVNKWNRFASYLVDNIYIMFYVFMVSNVMRYRFQSVDSDVREFLGMVIAPVFLVLAFYLQEIMLGQSIGKIITGRRIHLVGQISWGKAVFIRNIARLIPFEAFSALFSKDGRGWHDTLSKTTIAKPNVVLSQKEEADYVPPAEKVNVLKPEELEVYNAYE